MAGNERSSMSEVHIENGVVQQTLHSANSASVTCPRIYENDTGFHLKFCVTNANGPTVALTIGGVTCGSLSVGNTSRLVIADVTVVKSDASPTYQVLGWMLAADPDTGVDSVVSLVQTEITTLDFGANDYTATISNSTTGTAHVAVAMK